MPTLEKQNKLLLFLTNTCNSGNSNLRQPWISGEDLNEVALQDLCKSCQYFETEEMANIYHAV